jgi:hypothetical protein
MFLYVMSQIPVQRVPLLCLAPHQKMPFLAVGECNYYNYVLYVPYSNVVHHWLKSLDDTNLKAQPALNLSSL